MFKLKKISHDNIIIEYYLTSCIYVLYTSEQSEIMFSCTNLVTFDTY